MTPLPDPFSARPHVPLPATDLDLVAGVLGPSRVLPPHANVKLGALPTAKAHVVREGWVCSYKILPNGDRQIVDFLISGDVIGSIAPLARPVDLDFETVTETELVEIPVLAVRQACGRSPELVEALLSLIALDRAKLVEHLVDVGRRDSVARVAHLLLELGHRLMAVGRASSSGYACPLTQNLIADALGLTAIHVNRVLRRLRTSGFVTFRHGHVTFHNVDRLVALTGFDPGYVNGAYVARTVVDWSRPRQDRAVNGSAESAPRRTYQR